MTPGVGATGTSGTSACTATLTLTSGNLAVAEVSAGTGYTGNTYTIAGGPTWTQFASSPFADSGAHVLKTYWWAIMGSTFTSQAVTMTGTNSNPWLACEVQQWSSTTGWPAAPVDLQATASNEAVATPVCPTTVGIVGGTTGTTGQAVELIVGLFVMDLGATLSAGTGYTQQQTITNSGIATSIESMSSAATGAFQATANWCTVGAPGTNNGSGITITLKPN